jgi:tetratricopeptide (TPR) repeat protein
LGIIPTHPRACFLAAEANRILRYLEDAEHYYRLALQSWSSHSPSWTGLGATLFDQLAFVESQTCTDRAIRVDPKNPSALYLRALLRERRGDEFGATRDYGRAHRLAPELFPRHSTLSSDEILAMLDQAVEYSDHSVRTFIQEVSVHIMGIPSASMCADYEPPAPPAEIVGYFSSVPLSDDGTGSSPGGCPGTIVLFQKNLERMAGDPTRLLTALQSTIVKEIEEYLGMDHQPAAVSLFE